MIARARVLVVGELYYLWQCIRACLEDGEHDEEDEKLGCLRLEAHEEVPARQRRWLAGWAFPTYA